MKINVTQKTNSNKENFKYLSFFVLKSLICAVLSFLLIIVIGIGALFIDSAYNLQKGNDVVPLFGGYVIVSQSMIPTLNVGDAVIIKRSNSNDLDIGDIITFSNQNFNKGLTITHRIIATQETSEGEVVYRTKGDNNSSEDTYSVDLESIKGKVIMKVPKIGYLQNFLKTPIGFIMLILLPIGLILYINLHDYVLKRDNI